MEQIAEGRSRVWHSNKPASEQSSRRVAPRRSRARQRRASSARRVPKADGKAARRRNPPARYAACRTALRRAALGAAELRCAEPCDARHQRPEFGADWVHEIKFDGYRMQARIGGGKVELRTRTGLDWTDKIPDRRRGARRAEAPRRDPRRRDRVGRRKRRLGFLRPAGRPQERPARPAGLLRVRPAASRRLRPDRRDAARPQGDAAQAARHAARQTASCGFPSTSRPRARRCCSSRAT